MRVKSLTPKNVLLGLKRVYFTFLETTKLIWKIHPGLLATVFLVNILVGLLVFPTLYLEKLTIDALVKNIGNPFWQEALRILVLLFFLRVTVGIVQSALVRLSGYLKFAIAKVFSAYIETLLAQKMAQLDIEIIEDVSFKNRFNKVEREGGRRAWGLAFPLSDIPNYLFGLVSTFSIIFFFRPAIALIIFLFALPEFFVDARYTKMEYKLDTEVSPKYRLRAWMAYYLIRARSLLETKILQVSPYFIKRIKELQEEIFTKEFDLRRRKQVARFLTFLPQNILTFFFSLYFGLLAIWQKISVGSAEMYLRAVYSFQGNLTGLIGSFLELYENYLFVTDFIWFLNLKPKITKGRKKVPKKIKRGIEFQNVWFKYKEDQPWVLKGINLSISLGEPLAIIGENGAGKTTLVKLLCRFYDPQKGKILIDGEDLTSLNRDQLWKKLAVLFQNFETYPFTARESIGYGKIEEVRNVNLISGSAKKAAIHEFISSLPLKYENPLARDFEEGVEPSLGQWQRIGLARVLLRGADIVVLDEPTSNVDPKAEEEIFNKIQKLVGRRILILISHRFSTVRRATKICVIDKGKIIEEGTHKALMKKKGIYTELFELQAKSYR